MNEPLQSLERELSGECPRNAPLDDLMARAREAQSRTGNLLEDLAREIDADEHALAAKYARFNAIVGEIIDTPNRIQGQQ